MYLCIFNDCHTSSNYGGSIFMGSGYGSCVINKCCSNACSSTNKYDSYGQFIYLRLTDDSKHINKVLDSSVIKSQPPEEANSGSVLSLNFAIITMTTVNLSLNKCSKYPSAYCCPYSTSSTTCFVSYCSIRNNTATSQYGIYFYRSSSTEYSLSNSNLIENDISGSYGLVYCYGHLTIDECTILENSASRIFYSASSSEITIINCTIEEGNVKGNKISGNGDVITTPSPYKASPDFIIPILCTEDDKGNCYAEYDSIDSLTPNLPKPEQTPYETQNYQIFIRCTHGIVKMIFESSTQLIIGSH